MRLVSCACEFVKMKLVIFEPPLKSVLTLTKLIMENSFCKKVFVIFFSSVMLLLNQNQNVQGQYSDLFSNNSISNPFYQTNNIIFQPNPNPNLNTPFDPYGNYINNRRIGNYSNLPKYMVIAPSIIQPDSLYTAVVTLIDVHVDIIDVYLSLSKDGIDIKGNYEQMANGETNTISLQVPRQITTGNYTIRIEGNYLNSKGGTIFVNTSMLAYSEKFLAILIQTNRYVYNGGQKVMFRIITLKRDLLPYEDNVEVYILDARGFIMRRWPSVSSNFGVADLVYELPDFSNLGKWRVKVEAGAQVEEKEFIVEKYFQPLYEIYVSLPQFILSSEAFISGTVNCIYATEKTCKGNATAMLYGFFYGENERERLGLTLDTIEREKIRKEKDYEYIGRQDLFLSGTGELEWNLRDVVEFMGSKKHIGVRLEVFVTEYFIEETRMGFAESRIIEESLNMYFVQRGPLVFKPGLPFETVLSISYNDLERIAPEILEESTLRILPQVVTRNGERINLAPIEILSISALKSQYYNRLKKYEYEFEGGDRSSNRRHFYEFEDINTSMENTYGHLRYKKYWKDGILEIKFIPPKGSIRLIIQAEYSDRNGNHASATATANSFYSPSNRFISISTASATSGVAVGEFSILSVNSNFPMDDFHYIIIAKGLIITSGTEKLPDPWSLPFTMSVAVSKEMSPGFRMLVYHAGKNDEIISDSVFVPIGKITRHSSDLTINQNKDRLKDNLEVRFIGDPGASFFSSVQRGVRFLQQTPNELTAKNVYQSLHSLEPHNQSIHRILRRSRAGEDVDRAEYFPSMNYGIDTLRTFEFSNLLLFTELYVPILPGADLCREGQLRCATEGCYYPWQRCDKIVNCIADSSDEFNCDDYLEDDITDFRVRRISRFLDYYDAGDGDWLWKKENIAHGGDYILVFPVPKISDSWYINAFSVSKETGFAVIDTPIYYETTRPFMMILDAPSGIRRGEQVGIIANLYNKMPKDIFVWVTLHGSDDYQFVQVEEGGHFEFKHPKTRYTSGDHQHFVWIPAESELELRIPITPTIEQGTMEVTITATTQIRTDTASVEIDVLAEGVQIGKHTSLILNLRNRAVELKFIDIWTEETPIIPYELQRKYIFGTPAGHVTITGDIMGPIFNSDPLNMGSLLGKPGKGTADRIFDFAANTWHLHYLRLTNQLESSFARKILNELNKIFAHIMKRFRPRGYFKMWNLARPSVWLSSWAIQLFKHASFQDWENYFFVEPRIFSLTVDWLLRYQTPDGSFTETIWYRNSPLNKRMANKMMSAGPYNISLTAHLAITLQEVLPFINGNLRIDANVAKSKAINYLEKHLTNIQDINELALTTYALTLCDSPEKELAFGLLHNRKIDEFGFIYWAPEPVNTNGIIWENNRPFLQPKNNEFWDAFAVETTSYALLVHLLRDGVTMENEKIITWLNTMKMTDGGFIGILDTAVALQALCEYSYRARLRDITEMEVLIETPNNTEIIKINSQNIIESQTVDIPNVWGFVNVIARGAGQAVIQLDMSYGIDWEEFKDSPPKDCFELRIREMFSSTRNKSSVTYESCFRWIFTEESEVSGAAVLEVEIPSGYGLLQSDAIELVSSLRSYNLPIRDSWMTPGKTFWFFNYIPANWTCFNHTVNRWYPVANLTTHKQASLYEAYAIERFVNTMYNDTSLRELDICQVCGSYMCPYCPFYSKSPLQIKSPSFFGTLLLSFIVQFIFYINY